MHVSKETEVDKMVSSANVYTVKVISVLLQLKDLKERILAFCPGGVTTKGKVCMDYNDGQELLFPSTFSITNQANQRKCPVAI